MGLRSLAPRQLQFSLLLGMKVLREGLVTFLAALTEAALCKRWHLMSWETGGSENEGLHFLAVTSQAGASRAVHLTYSSLFWLKEKCRRF